MANLILDELHKMFENAPEILTRKQIFELTGGAVSIGHIANCDSQGRGIANRKIIFKKTCYPKSDVLNWLASNIKV